MFDPLAVMLVIAYNQALIDRKKDEPEVESINIESASEPMGFTALIEDEEDEIEEDMERMDIIGQNGNDGLHYELEESDVEPREENDPGPKKILKGGVKIK